MKALIKLYDSCVTGLAALSALLVVGLAFLIVSDVILRTLGFDPLAATVALTEYALLYFTMGAAPWLVRRRGHVAVRVMFDRLSPALQKRWEFGIYLLCALIAFAIAAVALSLMIDSLALGDVEQRSIDVPRWLLFLPLTVGFAGVGLEFLRFPLTGTSFYATDDPAGPEKI